MGYRFVEEYLSLPYAANALAFSPDEERLVTAMEEFKVWDVLNRRGADDLSRI